MLYAVFGVCEGWLTDVSEGSERNVDVACSLNVAWGRLLCKGHKNFLTAFQM